MIARILFEDEKSLITYVVSFINKDCTGTPSVLARVSAGLDWINTTACQYTGEWCDECKDLEDEEDTNDTVSPHFICVSTSGS